jgi:uncharacterized membrane protein
MRFSSPKTTGINLSRSPIARIMPSMPSISLLQKKWFRLVLIVILVILASVWFELTPHGAAGKLDAVAYAVCHQIPEHTLSIGGKLLLLCARCTGMYLGTLIALLVLSSRNRSAGIPSKAKIIVLGLMFLIFVVDGVNSMLSSFFNIAPLYPPSNPLRLATGLIMGVVLGNLLLPLWNQTLWKVSSPKAVLSTWKELFFLILCEAVAGVMVWLDIPILYYPVTILSIGTIFLILTMVYSLLWSILLNKENSLEKFSDGWSFYLLGLICALLQIGLMDLLRFRVTGTWSGFQL